MKKSIITILGGILFATLFYQVGLGINVLLYSFYLIILYAVCCGHNVFKNLWTISLTTMMLATATAVTYHSSTLTLICYYSATLAFIGQMAASNTSVYVKFVNGLYSTLFSVFHQAITGQQMTQTPKLKYGLFFKILITALSLGTVFLIIYTYVNPVFANWINQLDFSFLDFGWIFMVILGCLISWNLISNQAIEELTKADASSSDFIPQLDISDADLPALKDRSSIGSWSIGLLNILLVIVLVAEVIFINGSSADLPASILSDAVHSGVYASIGSIILAIVILIYFFYGKLNFIAQSIWLRRMAYAWIVLNVLLVATVFTKNFLYMTGYGLSLKRLGVCIYLILCLVGLCSTFVKIHSLRSTTYLFRINTAVSFFIVATYSLINWSAVVTRYNINNDMISDAQLMRLYPQNALVLDEHGLADDLQEKNSKIRVKRNEWTKDRKWQEYIYIAHKLESDPESHD